MFKQLLSVLLESRCEFCQRTTGDSRWECLCKYCFQQLSSHQFSPSDRAAWAMPNRLKLDQTQAVFAWGMYDGQLKRAIALMKYHQKPEICNLLGTLLGTAWLDSKPTKLPNKITVVPIPLHHKKQQARGFNQAEVMAKSFCQITGYELNTLALIRIRETEAMFNLESSAARAKNIQGALQVGKKLPKYPVLLLDDVHTTGTTVQESIKVLQQKKIEVIGVVVAAKAGNRDRH
jgi:ComF family protein